MHIFTWPYGSHSKPILHNLITCTSNPWLWGRIYFTYSMDAKVICNGEANKATAAPTQSECSSVGVQGKLWWGMKIWDSDQFLYQTVCCRICGNFAGRYCYFQVSCIAQRVVLDDPGVPSKSVILCFYYLVLSRGHLRGT